MKVKKSTTLRTAVALLSLVTVAPTPSTADRVTGGTVAFVNVRVVSMQPSERKAQKKRQTVIVEEGRITEIGKASKVEVPDGAVVVAWLTLVVASLTLITGRWVRVGAPVLWLAMLTMQQGAPSALNAGDLLLRIWTAYFALFALVTPRRFLEAPLFGHVQPDGGRTWPTGPTWFVRLAQIQLSVIYPATIIAKLDGDTWREGTASLYALGLVDFERFWVPGFLRENLVLGNVMTWFTVAVELSLPFLLWTRRTRWFGIVVGLLMHLGFDYTMRLGFFLPAMTIGYLSFVRPDEVERVLGRARGGRRPVLVKS